MKSKVISCFTYVGIDSQLVTSFPNSPAVAGRLFGKVIILLARVRTFLNLLKLAAPKNGYIMHGESTEAIFLRHADTQPVVCKRTLFRSAFERKQAEWRRIRFDAELLLLL